MDAQMKSLPVPTPIRDALPTQENEAIEYTIKTLKRDFEVLQHSNETIKWGTSSLSDSIMFFYYGEPGKYTSKVIIVKQDMSIEVRFEDKIVKANIPNKVHSFQDLLSAMMTLSNSRTCRGPNQYTPCASLLQSKMNNQRCHACRELRLILCSNLRRRTKRSSTKESKIKKTLKNLKQQNGRMRNYIKNKEETIEELQSRCAALSETTIETAIKNFSKEQQEAVKACMAAAKCKGPTGIRYTNDWILECLLIRIKSRKTYEHLRTHQILQLPSINTLTKYLKNLQASYGFCSTTFELLRLKATTMEPEDRRGTLVLDEMQLSEGINFDRKDMLFKGFTDLGKYTPDDQKSQRGNHALVFLFQPFRGKWVQTVGAFLSKGCANSRVLNKLILECILLLEKADFYVDVVTTDGASWNRSMWKLFGIEGQNSCCTHPCSNDIDSSSRQLWFCSDFSHLIKLLRNLIMFTAEIWTPDGIVRKRHFEAVLDLDGGKMSFGLKNAHKLTHHHLNPKFYQKMNVAMAVQVFSLDIAIAMSLYKEKDTRLTDSDSTVAFIKRVNKVIVAMTSRSPVGALKLYNESFKAISDFQEYLEEWHDEVVKNDWKFLSFGTYQGFRLTLNSTIGVMTYLIENCGYEYLMTSRLNQDALEGMFGMYRDASGSSDHPDPLLFIQIYRLMSFYSLVKPPKGSNVEGSEIFDMLLDSKDVDLRAKTNHLEWNNTLEKIIKRGENHSREYDSKDAHDYNVQNANEYAQAYFSGFIAHKIHDWTSCSECLSLTCKRDGDCERDKRIILLSNGYLKFPSDTLFNLLLAIERAILKTIGGEELNCYSFQHITENILAESFPFIGCKEHKGALTKRVIQYYTLSRAHILSKTYNKIYDGKKQEMQKHRKRSKLS